MQFQGVPFDELDEVLATGVSDVRCGFISLSARERAGRDAEYIAWHSLDHRPEQHRLGGLRHALRIVSTPACRSARAVSIGAFDAVDHVMSYFFSSAGDLPGFSELGRALNEAGRMPLRLPSLGYMTGDLAGKAAAPRAIVGADVIPGRPTLGVYLIIEDGEASPRSLVDAPGVAGVWWFHGTPAPPPYGGDSTGKLITLCYLDQDPVAVAQSIGERVRDRWASGATRGLLAAPFFTIAAFDWSRHLP